MHLTVLLRRAALLLAAALAACSAVPNPVLRTLQQAVQGGGVVNPRLDPHFRYLRVAVDGAATFLILGNEEADPRGPVEVWYSVDGEVLRLQRGRLVGAVGLPTEWRRVVLPALPAWAELARTGQPLHWTRERDVMPGYHWGVRDALRLRVTAPPRRSVLQGVDPGGLTWFEEEMDPESGTAGGALPAARYGVDLRGGQETVVYGEQCLTPTFCFSWQRWPASPRPAGQL